MPTFGRSFLSHWWLDPESTYLNHGTVGATPRVVTDAQHAWQRRIEAQPAAFLFRELVRLGPDQPGAPRPLLRQTADTVGAFLGARGDDLVFVDNASTGINAVLRSLALQPGDEIVVLDQAYGAVVKAAEFVARAAGAKVVVAATPFPVEGDITTALCDAVERMLTPRTRLAVIDHIASDTALVLPVQAMVARCRAHGVPVLVDGAHAPGSIALDIDAIGADWYVGNLHKWAFAPRACAFLWVAPARRATLHPPVISWGLDAGLSQEFDWTGTRDPSAVLSAPAGIAFMRDVLGLQAMRTWNHDLVWRMAHTLAARWGQPFTTPQAMVGCMASVALPARIDALGAAAAPALKDWLFHERRIEAQVLALRGRVHVRLAAQVYNDESDFERLAHAVDQWPPDAMSLLLLAPMEGLLDHPLREVLTAVGGIDRCVSEFIRVTDMLMPDRVFTRIVPELLQGGRTLAGVPVRPQLLGSDPHCLADNAAALAALKPDGIDLNFGCPAKVVNRHGGGASLLQDPELLGRIVAAVRRAVPAGLPVSAKMRLGFEDASRAVECAQALAGGGASELVVHARSKADGYRPPAYWERVPAIREAVSIPVVANGEIWTPDDAQRCRHVTGCDSLMLGRGIVADPGLALSIRARRRDGVASSLAVPAHATHVRIDAHGHVKASAGGPQSPAAYGAAPAVAWEELLPFLADFWRRVSGRVEARQRAGRLKQWLNLLRRRYPEAQDAYDRLRLVNDPAVLDAAMFANVQQTSLHSLATP